MCSMRARTGISRPQGPTWDAPEMCSMHAYRVLIAGTVLLCAIAYPATGSAAEDGRFEKLSVYLERNVQDRDVEIVSMRPARRRDSRR